MRLPPRPPLPLSRRQVDGSACQQRGQTPAVGGVVGVRVAVRELLGGRRRGVRERGVRVQGRVGGLGAAVEVAGDEGGAGFQAGGVGFGPGRERQVSRLVEGRVDEGRGVWEGELALRDAGGEADGL